MYKSKSIRFFATTEDHMFLASEIAKKFPEIRFEEEDNRNPYSKEVRILSNIKSNNYSDIDAIYIKTCEESFESQSYLRIHKPHPQRNHSSDYNLRDDVIERMSILGSSTIVLISYGDERFNKFYNYVFRTVRKNSRPLKVINPNIDEYINHNPPGAYNFPKAYEWSKKQNHYLMNSSMPLYYKP
jgi:hypothetical protein